VAGKNTPYTQEAFASMGTRTVQPGRSISSSDLQETNAGIGKSYCLFYIRPDSSTSKFSDSTKA